MLPLPSLVRLHFLTSIFTLILYNDAETLQNTVIRRIFNHLINEKCFFSKLKDKKSLNRDHTSNFAFNGRRFPIRKTLVLSYFD